MATHTDERAAQVARDLFGGDPLQRNLAAHALARPLATGEAQDRLALLIEALDDSYPSVRWFAWRGAGALLERGAVPGQAQLSAALAEFDYLGPAATRVVQVAEFRKMLGVDAGAAFRLRAGLREGLEAAADDAGLWIGE